MPAHWHEQGTEEHPHVRGEELAMSSNFLATVGTPPRAWGRESLSLSRRKSKRNTPTCVGKRLRGSRGLWRRGEHPHVRGEETLILSPSGSQKGTPPRAWGREREIIEYFSSFTGKSYTKSTKRARSAEKIDSNPHITIADHINYLKFQYVIIPSIHTNVDCFLSEGLFSFLGAAAH